MKAAIIGAGVSGLAAGCYLRMSGFRTEIFESRDAAGGLCTSWKRGEFTFESGFQWLLGSGPGNPFYQLWSELIDMEDVPFHHHRSRMNIEVGKNPDIHGSKVFRLYTNLGELGKYLLDQSPQDHRVIRKMIRSMRKMQGFGIPPMIGKVPELLSWREKILSVRYLPLLWFLNRLKKETNFSMAQKLKDPFLKEAFSLLFDGEELPLMILTLPLAFSDLQATGYPIGGATAFIKRIEQKYRSLGGTIHYHSPVEKIMTEGGRATGIRLENGKVLSSDIVFSAADWHFTVFNALEGKYTDKTIRLLAGQQKLKIYYSVVLVSLGIGRKLDDLPHFLRFPLEEELVSPDGTRYSRLESHIYNYDPTLAPPGKTVVSVSFYTRNAEYWISLRESDRDHYNLKKQEFAGNIIGILDRKFGRIREYIEETDVATPATFHRYTGNWKGSVQGWFPGKNLIARSPVKSTLPGLKDFYYAGHWSIPGGGLPVAIKSARDAVQVICRDKGMRFNSKG